MCIVSQLWVRWGHIETWDTIIAAARVDAYCRNTMWLSPEGVWQRRLREPVGAKTNTKPMTMTKTCWAILETCDIWDTDYNSENLNSWNLCDLTFNCDTGQHSQFLRCLYQIVAFVCIFKFSNLFQEQEHWPDECRQLDDKIKVTWAFFS